MAQHGVDRVLLSANALAGAMLPGLDLVLHQRPDPGEVGQLQLEARGEPGDLRRQPELVADEHQRALGLVVAERDLLDEPHVDRILEEPVGVEHDVDPVLRRRLDVPEAVAEVVRLGHPVSAPGALQPLDDAPDEQRPALEVRDPLEEREHPPLLVRLDDHERKA